MWRNLSMYFRFSGQNVRALMEYKNDFLVSTAAGALMQSIGLLFLFVLFQNIHAIAGWGLYDVALLYASMMIAEGALTLGFQGTTGLNYFVRTGDFDRFLLRPLPLTTQLLGMQINFAGLGTMIAGASVVAYALARLPAPPGAGAVLLYALNLALGVCIRVNINLACSSMAFWLISSGGLTTTLYQTQEFGRYPLEIYPVAVRIVLLTILPHAMISYVPVCLLTGRLSAWPHGLWVPASMVFMFLLRRFIFGRALKRYESAGN